MNKKMRRKAIVIMFLYAAILFFITTPMGIANAEEYEVTFVLPDRCVIGTDLIIKGTSTGGDTVDIAIDDIMVAIDVPIDENGRFTKKIPSGAETILWVPRGYVVKAYVNGPKDRNGNSVEIKVGERIPEGLGIFDDGDTVVIMTDPTLSVEQSINFVVQESTYSITGIAPGSDYVDIAIVCSKGSYGVGIDGGYGIAVYRVSVSKTDYTFSKTITVYKNAEDGRYTAMVLSPGRDQLYGDYEDKIEDIADLITSGIFDLKTQSEALDLLTSKTINATTNDDLSQSFSFIVGKEAEEFLPPRTSVTAEQLTNIVARGDSYRISGTCYGSSFVNIITISPQGEAGNATDGAKPGFRIYTLLTENHRFSKRIPVDKYADSGVYAVLVLSPGRNDIYDGIGTGDLEKGLNAEYNLTGRDRYQLALIILDATIEAAGSNDLLQVLQLRIKSPYIDLGDIEDFYQIGDELKINGTTNREPGTKIMISFAFEGPPDLPMTIAEVKWPTPDEGVFTAIIDTYDAGVGHYWIEAYDGEGNGDDAIVDIVTILPTPKLPESTATPTPSPTPTQHPWIERIKDVFVFLKKDINWVVNYVIALLKSVCLFIIREYRWLISVCIMFLILVFGPGVWGKYKEKKKRKNSKKTEKNS